MGCYNGDLTILVKRKYRIVDQVGPDLLSSLP